jgi:hypothetical protein
MAATLTSDLPPQQPRAQSAPILPYRRRCEYDRPSTNASFPNGQKLMSSRCFKRRTTCLGDAGASSKIGATSLTTE